MVSDREEARGGAGITNQMLIQLQSTRDIFIVAATNRPHKIDEAFRRRFDRLIYIPLPKTCQERAAIVKFHLSNTNHTLLDRDFYFIGSVTDGFSPADLELIVKTAKNEALKRTEMADYFMPCPINKQWWWPAVAKDANASKLKLKYFNKTRFFYAHLNMKDMERAFFIKKKTSDDKENANLRKFCEQFGESDM